MAEQPDIGEGDQPAEYYHKRRGEYHEPIAGVGNADKEVAEAVHVLSIIQRQQEHEGAVHRGAA